MSCRLLQNITHSYEYNAGGITNIYLLDIRDFISHKFSDDRLYDSCYVNKINTSESFVEIGAANQSSFTETNDNGLYKQELTTFISTLSADKLSDILLAASNKHLVAFRTSQGRMYCFGSDDGASLSFSQITGQTGETAGYSIIINKSSIYPLFEINPARFNTIQVLGTEDKRVIDTDDKKHAILILGKSSSTNKIFPDEYQRGEEDSVFITIPTNTDMGSGILGYDYDNMIRQPKQPIEKTYKTIIIDEYEWTQEDLIAEFTNTLTWANLTEANIYNITGRKDISTEEFRMAFGGLFGRYPETSAYYNFDKSMANNTRVRFFRNKDDIYRTDAEMDNWNLPNGEAIYQLLGQTPRNRSNMLEDINDFIFSDKNNFDLGWELLNRRNISGLTLSPIGLRGNINSDLFYGYPKAVALQSSLYSYQHRIQNMAINPQPKGVAVDFHSYHMTQVRYCRRLPDDELGYKLYVDEFEDKVWMLDTDIITDFDELKPSLERGVALRYANRANKVILKSWSEIKSEASNIRKSIIVN